MTLPPRIFDLPRAELAAKEVGFDALHVGDAGYHGVGDPLLLYAYSLAVRGRRHTWRRMALGARTPQR